MIRSKNKFLMLLLSLFLIGLQPVHAQNQCPLLFKETLAIKEIALPKELEKNVRVAVIQYPLDERFTEQQFYKKVDGYLLRSKNQGSELVVFPELITTEMVNWQSAISEIDQLSAIAKNFTPNYKLWLQAKAKEYNLAILGGTTPQFKNNKIVNTALLAMPDGKILEQDKIFLTPDEKAWGWSEGKSVKVYDTKWGSLVILICFDSEFPVISNKMAKAKPDLVLIPSWTSSQAGFNRVDWSSRARAIEHYAYIIKTGTVVSKTSTQPHFGNAVIYSPQDAAFPVVPAEGRINQDTILFENINLDLLRKNKAKTGYYPANEQLNRKNRILILNR